MSRALDVDNLTLMVQCMGLSVEEKDGFRDIFDGVIKLYRAFEDSLNVSKSTLRSTCRLYMDDMCQIYRNELKNRSLRSDFSDIFTQWSYMYKFMLRHAHLVSYALDATSANGILTDPAAYSSPTVCMIGGGPGSDVLGLIVHLRNHGHSTPLTSGIHVLDKCTKWKTGWELLHLCLPKRYRRGIPQINYQAFDYEVNDLSVKQQNIVKKANIVTMIKSLSPVAAWLKDRPKLYNYHGISEDGRLELTVHKWHSVFSILKHMKPGAFLLYIDNQKGPQREILMDAVDCFEFDNLYDNVLYGQSLPDEIFSLTARMFMIEIDRRPCTTAGTNEVILLRKKTSVISRLNIA